MPGSIQAGDVLAGRYRLEDLLSEARGARFWRAHDSVLHRPVAVHIVPCDDERADDVLAAARRMGPLDDRRVLRVLDADQRDNICFVVSEWGQGESLDNLLLRDGPLPPRRAAWLVAEVADSMARAHDVGLTHGRLTPENVLIDHHGDVRIIGFGIESTLHHRPSAPESADVTALAALLHASLTGRWAGSAPSQVPPAPTEGGRVLRPRRVRAGIPRQLDTICDEVLNEGASRQGGRGRSGEDLSSARGIADLLFEFVGDAGQMSAPTPRSTGARDTARTSVVPPIPAPPPEAVSGPAPDGAADPAVPPSTDLPTQAGMPVFHDDTDEVEWLRARSEKPAPPPPLEPTQAKPLFAPDPPEGQPVRRPRAGAQLSATSADDYWPWEASSTNLSDTGARPAEAWGTGDWRTGDWGTGTHDTGDRVPGRSWIRLAMLIALAMAVLVAAVAAYQLGLGGQDDTTTDDEGGGDTNSSAPLEPFSDVTADDFDPQGSPPRDENPDLVPLAVDGDVATTWRTSTYRQNFGPGGLKSGVGLVLDLGSTRAVREVSVTVAGGATGVSTYVTEASPTGVVGLTPTADASGDGELTLTFDEAVSGRYVTVWLTSIPAVEGGFRGEVAEVEVRG